MKRQGGFTLIELVVVIVILGILAVTAAPRFLDLQSDARASSLQGLKGAMAGAAGIVYGKAAIEGVETAENTDSAIDIDGIDIRFGYPKATADGIGEAVDGLGDNGDWTEIDGHDDAVADTTIVYGFAGEMAADATCVVTYTVNDEGIAPTIVAAVAEDC